MAKKPKPDFATRTSRKRTCPVRPQPYWQRIGKGRALGYVRTSAEPGRWQVRVRAAGTSSGYRFATLATADDLAHQEADGEQVLESAAALAKAGAWDPYAGEDADDEPEEFGNGSTVAEVCEAYLKWAEENTKSADSMRLEIEAHIKPKLGNISVDKLKVSGLRKWHRELAEKPARIRSSKDGKQRYKPAPKTADEKRARKATSNRILTILKAALHRQWAGERVLGPWSSVQPFSSKQTHKSRARFLEPGEVRRLLNAIDEPEFRSLVEGALLTGCRYAELGRLRFQDVHLDTDYQSVVVEESKSGESRAVFLNADGVTLFESLAAGKTGGDLVFTKPDGTVWGKSQQRDRLIAACETAGIDPPVTFHQLRHSYSSAFLMNGGSPTDLAEQLGHAGTKMIERHYKHLTARHRAEQARRAVPSLGIEPGKLRRMRKRGRR